MKVVAYASEMYAEALKRAAGVTPITSPPVTGYSVNVKEFEGAGVLIFMLHGELGDPVWRGEGRQTIGPITLRPEALRVDQLRGLDLQGTVILLGNCWSGNGPDVFRPVLFEAGASAIIAGEGANYSERSSGQAGFPQLVRWFLSYYPRHSVRTALLLSKLSMVANLVKGGLYVAADVDTLAFKLFERG